MTYIVQQTEEFDEWLSGLRDGKGQKVIAKRIVRAQGGNLGTTRSLGDEVSEMKIDFGPGYRLYYTVRGKVVVILLCGGDKGSQDRDIERAKELAKIVEIQDGGDDDEDEGV
ncbi:type II toxin-antitoxin system RelE/ParE family toxin [Sphingobium sp. YR768]|uniref:type II toxin-antitoxin system RelE/ParE family toxin n=1 Tax=Sphingobium sp. YR768 TaxID=1884365 RepID=UPI0008B93409|nr:type II toxin-antitoxin system RelE/ParE family toxin [Sphingobium sp. YR768]SES19753.1 putative addiction module killer protein [Sphingobium sp. YR768]